ncbi:hypothetical protein FDECE_586 [Fusarium decemcellulare]|nr:hypothetical protein FDECE_586 [Fusarium decemcellulare]
MPSNEPEYRFKANLRSEAGDTFVDLNAGGGQDPPVIAYSNNSNKTNPNQIWDFYSVPGFDTRVVVKNSGNKYVLFADGSGSGRKVRCEKGHDVWDAAAQWYLEGGQVTDIGDNAVVRLRNVKYTSGYLDLSGSETKNHTPFLVYPGHGGPNQAFKLLKR